jgi:UDP-N-acetylmuramoylalanine--D-glutamate ligase
VGDWSELGLFAQALADLRADSGYAPAVLAVTGTNGKTTVTALTGQLVERAGKPVAVAGNIGPTLLDTLAKRSIDAGTLPQVWVLELSSFQLDGVVDFEPTAATVLNITQDHLDWHGDMQAYAAAKAASLAAGPHGAQPRRPAVMAMLPEPVRVKGAKSRSSAPHHLWRRHAAAPGRLRHRGGERHGLAGARAGADETRKRGRSEEVEECTSSA